MSLIRSRWAAVGAAVAVTLGAGGIGLVSATSPSDAATFVPITPCRVMDTRTSSNVGPKTTPLGPGEVHTVNAISGNTGDCSGIPATASGVSLNITALDATLPTFLTVWATGAAQPDASSLNPVPDAPPTPNAVASGLNGSGQFDIYNLQGTVDVIADINGYYTDHHHDDRYYTKGQVDDAIAAGDPPPTSAQPSVLEYLPQTGDWEYTGNGWRYGGAGYSCLAAPIDAPEGTQIASVDVVYSNTTASSIDQVGVLGIRNTAGQIGFAATQVHLFNGDVALAALPSGQSATLNIVHDQSEVPVAISRSAVGGDDYDLMISLCGQTDQFSFHSATVNYG